MKTLVIHPFDPTTAFLSYIYEGKDWTVITTNVSKRAIKNAIKAHDRIIMMGHGSGIGLIGFGRLIIDSTIVYSLRKKEIVCIWCNADVFVRKYELKGLHTGMIISDQEEAYMYCVPQSGDDIEDSNKLFAESIKNHIDSKTSDMVQLIKEEYKSDMNYVIKFNHENIFI